LTRLIGKQPCITFVTLGELTQWAELRRWGRRNRDALDSWLDGVIILPYSEDVARTWGRISAAATQRGRPRPANDTWIAACALTYGLRGAGDENRTRTQPGKFSGYRCQGR
jgi:hypothetical protein